MSRSLARKISPPLIALGLLVAPAAGTVLAANPASASTPNCEQYNEAHGGTQLHQGTFGPNINFAIWRKGVIYCVRTWNNSKVGTYSVREWMTRTDGSVLTDTTSNYMYSTAVVFSHTSGGYRHVTVQGAYRPNGSSTTYYGAKRQLW